MVKLVWQRTLTPFSFFLNLFSLVPSSSFLPSLFQHSALQALVHEDTEIISTVTHAQKLLICDRTQESAEQVPILLSYLRKKNGTNIHQSRLFLLVHQTNH